MNHRQSTSVFSRLVAQPVLWAVLSLSMGLVAVFADRAGFFSYLCSLFGGWLCAVTIIAGILRLPRVKSWIVHVALSVALVPIPWLSVEIVPDLLTDGAVARAFSVFQLALPPFAGWIWIVLISRLSSAARTPRPEPVVPAWRGEGADTILRVHAIPIRLRSLSLAIVAIVLVLGVGVVALMIAFDDFAQQVGARIVIIVVGVAVGLPAYAALLAYVRRSTVPVTVIVINDRIRVTAADHRCDLSFTEITRFVWGGTSDYARIEIVADGIDISLIVGMAKQTEGRTSTVPDLLPRMIRQIELAGLNGSKNRRGVWEFTRAA